MKAAWFCLFLSISVCAKAQDSFSYSLNDKKSLAIANKKLDRLDNLSFIEVYHVGLEYERLYRTYKDTNMVHAIRCYENCCSRENATPQPMEKSVAFKLGSIYEKGIGVMPDTLLSMIWYNVSTPQGFKKYYVLEGVYCAKKPQLTLYGNMALDTSDTTLMKHVVNDAVPLFMAFLAPCNGSKTDIQQAFTPIVRLLQANPALLLRIGKSDVARPNLPSFYTIKTQNSAGDIIKQLQNYIVEKEGISSDRIVLHDFADHTFKRYTNAIYFIEMQLVSYDKIF